ncbi:multidrug ABC transporter ATP-binding protein [Sphingomonas sp. Sph1(2015)]|jgi:ATP-binding cassette subfamily B protein|uniref:ABC transporter ATP-binding protein n=1 Tax=Sphingomonas sp. Sph1(2015) TaxID=1628084 RepID=UPI000975F1C9|nr:ABC transporter ATP-binding protein [Sphingomonas sp. Sph1(2015)]OMJ33736.1 multidrug ABC transporter ATP-binding protein [Sphingomonas sp. Sph1(2015)]
MTDDDEDLFPRASVLRKVLSFTFRLWRRTPLLAAACAIAMLLSTLTEVFVPLYAGRMIDAVGGGDSGAAWLAFGVITLLGAAMVVFRHLGWWAITPLTLGMMRDVTQEAFARVQRLSSDWHANAFSGSTVRRITRGMWALDTLNDVLLLSLLPSLTVLLGTVVLLAAHWPLLGSVMGVGALAYIVLTVGLATRVLAPIARLSNQWDTKLGGVLADAIGTNAVVKAFGGEAQEEALLKRTVAKWHRRTRRTWMAFTWAGSGQLALLWLIRIVATGAALWLWSRGQASAGDMAYVITSYLVLNGYLRDIGQYVHQLQRSVNEMEELVALHDEPLGVADRPDARPIAIEAGAIRFEDVTFRYAGQDRPLYEHLSVTIPAGQRVGLVGPSGSGKTSFVKLIQRLYDVDAGRVTIDGQDVALTTQRSLRQQVAIVPQEPVLFHRTLAENIGYGRPEASQDEIEQAARLANAHDFIMALPKGYRTLVGERGVKLSGGERQRVAIARAFLADAPILILDEATSSLDSESEAAIQQAMERLMVGRTAIVIAHRLSTVRALDRILVFSAGRIVEDGTHDDLLTVEGGHYRRLFERQAGSTTPEIA